MSRIRIYILRSVSAFVIFSAAASAQKAQLPDGAGKDVVLRVCSACHAPDMVTSKGNTRDGWTQVVGEMISRGAQGSDDDYGTIVDYLTANFPPKSDVKKVNVNKAEATELQTSLQFDQKTATSIVDYRKQNGDFKTLDDLKKVPGLDAARLVSVKDRIAF